MNKQYFALTLALGLLLATAQFSTALSMTPNGGFFNDTTSVTLSGAPGNTLQYTLDGSNPVTNGTISNDTILVTQRSPTPSSFSTNTETSLYPFPNPTTTLKATVLRATEITPSGNAIANLSRTFFIGLSPSNFTLPVFSVVLEDSDLQDNHTGMFVKGDDYYNYQATHPTANPLDPFAPANWNGNDTRRANADLQLYVSGTLALSDRASYYPSGRWSAALAKKSSKLNFDKTIGSATINYTLYGNQSENLTDKILFKSGGQDFDGLGIRDCVLNQALQGLNMVNTKCGQVDLFVNGEFYGVMNLQQQIDAKFLSIHFGGKKGDYVVLEQDGIISDGNASDNQKYFGLRNWLQNPLTNLSDPVQYANFTAQVNPDSLIDFMSSEAFIDNIDYPNDYLFWRVKNPLLFQPGTLNDGRWVFVTKDVDQSTGVYAQSNVNDNNFVGSWGYNFTGYLNHTTSSWGYLLFNKAMENPGFRQSFIDRNMVLLNTTFDSGNLNTTIDGVANARRPEVPKDIQRWQKPSGWETKLTQMKQWLAQRHDLYKAQVLSLGIVVVPADTTPPVITNGTPNGILPSGTTNITLTVTTDEAATCAYSNSPGTPYESMTTFQTTGGTQHNTPLNGLFDGENYTGFVKCRDTQNNTDSDYLLPFAIAPTPSDPRDALIAALQANITNLQGTISNLQANLSSCTAQGISLQGSLNTCQINVTACYGQNSLLQGSLNACNAQKTALQANLSIVQANLLTCQGQTTSLQNGLSTCQNSLAVCLGNATLPPPVIVNYTLTVGSLPNASITVNGTSYGTTPKAISLLPGTYLIKATATGYYQNSTIVSLSGNTSVNFVLVQNVTTPPANNTISATLQFAQWYPKQLNAVLVCNATGFNATTYDFVFGDTHKTLGYTQNNVYHTYPAAGTYQASCTARNGGVNATGNLIVSVTA